MRSRRVALLVIFRAWGLKGPEVFLQLHSDGKTWRYFGGHIEKGETPLQAVVREAREELDLHLNPQELGEGWTPLQLLCRLRLPVGRVFLFPLEVEGEFPPSGARVGEGAKGAWWPVDALPETMSLEDRLLLKLWMLRRRVLNQPYLLTDLACPVVTIDLEEAHHFGGRPGNARFDGRDCRLPRIVAELLTCLESAGAKATFFCVARTAKKYPEVLRDIVQAGHEVASHGLDHQLACTQTPSQLRNDLRQSKAMIEDIATVEVLGYRAPGWSCPRDLIQREHFYDALLQTGYRYSSSVIPAPLLGRAGLPAMPFQAAERIWEFPLPVVRLPLSPNLERHAKDGRCHHPPKAGRRFPALPYSGGLFLRCWGPGPARMILSYHLQKRGYAMLYAHPGDLGGWNARWITSLDDRYLTLAERWWVGFRSRRFGQHFQRLIGEYGGCSVEQFLARWPMAAKG